MSMSDLLPFAREEILEAFPHYLLARCGHAPADLHPVAERALERELRLPAVLGALDPTPGRSSRLPPPDEIMIRALGSSDVASAIADATVALANVAYSAFGVTRLCRRMPVPDFKPYAAPQVALDGLEEVLENGVLPTAVVTSSDALEQVGLKTYAARLRISRRVIHADDVGLIAELGRALGANAARLVSEAIATALESTDSLSDGDTLFSTTVGNLAAVGGAPSVTTLDAARSAMRAVADARGNAIGAESRYLVVPGGLESTARALVAAQYPAGMPGALEVVVHPHLGDAAAWYLVGDPDAVPMLALMSLGRSAKDIPLTVERGTLKASEEGLVLHAHSDFRVARIGRFGHRNPGA